MHGNTGTISVDRRLQGFVAGVGVFVVCYLLRTDWLPLCQATAELARWLLGVSGVPVQRAGMDLLHAGGLRVQIGIECTALLPVVALWAALWAVGPGVARRRQAALFGALLLIGLNTVRIAHLVSIGVSSPQRLWLWHDLFWQAIVIALPAVLFFCAARRHS